MTEKFDLKKLYAVEIPGNRQQAFDNVKNKDASIEERKAQIIEAIKELIVSENMQNPAKQLTVKVLQIWIDNNPDKFFGITRVDSVLKTYFYSQMSSLKFSLGLVEE
jgi:hypothetical protein